MVPVGGLREGTAFAVVASSRATRAVDCTVCLYSLCVAMHLRHWALHVAKPRQGSCSMTKPENDGYQVHIADRQDTGASCNKGGTVPGC